MSLTGCPILDKAGVKRTGWKKGGKFCLLCSERYCMLDRNKEEDLEEIRIRATEKIVQCQNCLDMATLAFVDGKPISQGKYRYENGQVVHRTKDKICGVCKVIK